MEFILDVVDKTGRKIHLSKERWGHIKQEHSQVESEEIEKTLINPIKIVPHEYGEIYDYYFYLKHKKSYLFS